MIFFKILLILATLRIAITDDDINEVLKKDWIEILNSYNSKLLNQQVDRFVDSTKLYKPGQTEQNALRYQGKFHFVMGRYEQALADLTKLLEFNTNDTFALKYRGETYYMMGKYEESLADLNKLLKINVNDTWALKACEKVTNM